MDEFLTRVLRKHQISEISFTKLLTRYAKKGINIEKMIKFQNTITNFSQRLLVRTFFCDTKDIGEYKSKEFDNILIFSPGHPQIWPFPTGLYVKSMHTSAS